MPRAGRGGSGARQLELFPPPVLPQQLPDKQPRAPRPADSHPRESSRLVKQHTCGMGSAREGGQQKPAAVRGFHASKVRSERECEGGVRGCLRGCRPGYGAGARAGGSGDAGSIRPT